MTKCNCPQCNESAKSEMDMDDILPCPWCGEREISIEIYRYERLMYGAECTNCQARSGLVLREDAALDAWNDRAKLWEPKAK